MLLHLVVLATLASVHGASWQHRNLRPTLWPLAFQPVPDFTDSQGQDVDPQIVGGEDAAEHEFPHQVSMQIEGRPYRTQHICGGTILAPSWVLTAAHCAWGVPEYTAVFVLAGKNNLAMVEQGQQRSYVSDMYAHAQYRTNWNHGVGPFDVALLKLLTPLTFSDTVKPAKLPARDQVPSGNAQLSGWGSISKLSTITIPDKLQKAVFPIIPFKECSEFIGEMSPDEVNPVRDTNICIGDLHQAGLSSCQGDSGGPLIQVDQSTKEVTVIGITSWGFTPCGRTPAPSVFTRVSAFIDWIEERAPELKQP